MLVSADSAWIEFLLHIIFLHVTFLGEKQILREICSTDQKPLYTIKNKQKTKKHTTKNPSLPTEHIKYALEFPTSINMS